jgi:hypothetical protein
MANSVLDQSNESGTLAPAQRDYRMWVIGLLGSAALLVVLGLWLAGVTDGVARPWMGAGFVVAMGLALVVGASKTSSA